MAKTRIMVVEDERIVALHLQQRLTKLGYEIAAVATSGEEALQKIQEHRPDVVLMDIHIDGKMDGIETASRVPEEWQVPIIYLTAYSEEATLERARGTKPYGYLLKPFSEREMHASIQMVLERRRADVALRESEQRLETLVVARTAELTQANEELTAQVAKRREAEDALHQARKMEAIGQLTGGIAHDFNNLLTAIGGGLHLIRQSTHDPARVDRLAGSALKAAERGEKMIKQLLMFSRRQVMRPEIVHTNQAIQDFEPLIAHRPAGLDIELVMKLAPDVKPTRVDPTQFGRALLNLVVNAQDASIDKGKIVIETQTLDIVTPGEAGQPALAKGCYVVVSVMDNGHGIAPEILPHVFEPFMTTKEVGKGSGLGLSQVYGFAQESGGQVTISSQVGRGTTVKLYLPCVEETQDEAAANSNVAPRNGALGQGTVLVVEDDELVLGLAVETLEELGYRVVSAANATRALAILKSDAPLDILFSDIVMPGGMNGAQLAAEARRLRPGLKIMLTSGYSTAALARHGVEHSASFLEKPYRPQDLADHFKSLSV